MGTPVLLAVPTAYGLGLGSAAMTNFQQALLHLATVIVAVTAIVALAVTGNLTQTATLVILGVTGFTSIGVAATTPSSSTVVTTPAPVGTKTVAVLPPAG